MAAELLPDYAEGVWVADLAGLSDLGLVPHTVAAAVAVSEQPGRPLTDTLETSLWGTLGARSPLSGVSGVLLSLRSLGFVGFLRLSRLGGLWEIVIGYIRNARAGSSNLPAGSIFSIVFRRPTRLRNISLGHPWGTPATV